jgi:mRNA interferase HigB
MRVISIKKLKKFWELYPESEAAFHSWYAEAKAATWKNPAEIKEQYGSASILKDSRVVFNICGNKYRLVVKINYPYSVVYVRFVGTHKEYDAIDAEVV